MYRLFIAAAVVFAAVASSAQASVSYQYVTDQSSYTAAAGGSVTVYFFLQEQLNGSAAIINNDTAGSFSGLYSAGFLATLASNNKGNGAFNTGSLTFNTNSATASLPGFTSSGNSSNKPNSTSQQGGVVTIGNNTAGPTTTNISSINGTQLASTITNAIYLGSATITAGSAGSVTTFTLESYKNFSGSNMNTITSNSGYDLDVSGQTSGGQSYVGANNNPFTFTVTAAAVPEPSSLLLCGFAMCGGAYSFYRRRRNQVANPVVPA